MKDLSGLKFHVCQTEGQYDIFDTPPPLGGTVECVLVTSVEFDRLKAIETEYKGKERPVQVKHDRRLSDVVVNIEGIEGLLVYGTAINCESTSAHYGETKSFLVKFRTISKNILPHQYFILLNLISWGMSASTCVIFGERALRSMTVNQRHSNPMRSLKLAV